MVDENSIPAPVNPLTKMFNLQVVRFVGARFFAKWLPDYVQVVTSDLRTVEHNKAVGGVGNSAHVFGLAEDFVLKYKATGLPVPEAEAKAIYDKVIAPNWVGFTEFEAASAGEGWHVHWNLSREVSTYTGLVAMAGLGVVGLAIINSVSNGNNGGA